LFFGGVGGLAEKCSPVCTKRHTGRVEPTGTTNGRRGRMKFMKLSIGRKIYGKIGPRGVGKGRLFL